MRGENVFPLLFGRASAIHFTSLPVSLRILSRKQQKLILVDGSKEGRNWMCIRRLAEKAREGGLDNGQDQRWATSLKEFLDAVSSGSLAGAHVWLSPDCMPYCSFWGIWGSKCLVFPSFYDERWLWLSPWLVMWEFPKEERGLQFGCPKNMSLLSLHLDKTPGFSTLNLFSPLTFCHVCFDNI